ncbi:MAG TPA: potassium channel protein [Rhodobacter sp.]|jgi:voltage-gated potassium channel|nr:MAG: potassium channel protein [Rhodobacter sp. BACL10 MAG-120910-bin24]HCB52663.1 potassium channel protein [Rhodobacter sp.]
MSYKSIQKRTLEILDQSQDGDAISKICDFVIIAFVMLNIFGVILETMSDFEARYHLEFYIFETFSIAFFTIEYFTRLWAAGAMIDGESWRGRVRYIFSFNGLVDLAATAPFYLQILMPGLDLRVLRILRLVRVFKLSHYSTAIEDLFSAVYQERKAFIAAIYLLLIAVILTSSLMYFAETTHQPDKFGSIPDAIYWSLITLTTVGYGDVSPVTGVGKIIAVSTAFMGVCVVALLTGIVASAFANQITRRKVIFESQLREALKDGTIDEDEQISLENLRVAFNLSEEQVAEFYLQAQKEQPKKKP